MDKGTKYGFLLFLIITIVVPDIGYIFLFLMYDPLWVNIIIAVIWNIVIGTSLILILFFSARKEKKLKTAEEYSIT